MLNVTFHRRLRVFYRRIRHVVAVRSKPQMFRVATGWVISTWTIMENVQTIRNWSIGYFPRHSVSTVRPTPKPKLTVFAAHTRADP